MAKRRRKSRTHVPIHQTEQASNAPKSFVLKTGKVTKGVSELVKNIRKALEPNTASRLKERRNNKLKDFVHVAGQLGVTHFVMFSKRNENTNMKIARSPRGPTLTFRVEQYALIKDILAAQSNPKSLTLEYTHAPLLVLNNFNKEGNQFKLMSTMLQNMFPTLNVHKLNAKDCQRVVLFNYDSESDKIHFRQYYVTMSTAGVSKSVKKVVKSALDLSKFSDISEYITKESGLSESEAEDDTGILNISDSSKAEAQKRVKLTEIGPRMTLRLIKVQNELCDGEVLYHSYVKRTEEEIQAQRNEHELKKSEKERRRKEQNENIDRKKQKLESKKAKSEDEQVSEENQSDYEELEMETDYEEDSLDDGASGAESTDSE